MTAKASRDFRARRRIERYGFDPIAGTGDNRHLWAMKAAPDISHLTPLDLAYLAGIIDGEGSIAAMSTAQQKKSVYDISIGTTSPELLSWLLERLPFGYILIRRPVSNSAGTGLRKQQYEFKLRGALLVIILLRALYPYLTIKAERAAEVLELLVPLYDDLLHNPLKAPRKPE